MNPDRIDIEEVEVERIRPLRTRVLRPGFEEGELLEYDGDDHPDAHHFAAADADGDEIVGVVSYLNESIDIDAEDAEIRLRGMAVADHRRRTGVGSHLLSTTLSRVALHHPEYSRVWASVRVGVMEFYDGHGFESVGPRFDLPPAGRHRRMVRKLPTVLA